jgi:cyclohexadienyl dehydratase
MKSRLIVLLLAFAVGLLGATPAMAQTKSRLQQILERGTLRVGTTGDFNPMSVRDPATNSYKGFDIDSMNQLAADMGVKVEWVQTDWASFVAGVAANKFDIFSGASLNMARAKTVGFTLPYTETGTVPVVLKANAGKFKSWDDINKADVSVAVSLGTVFEEQAKQHFPKASIKAVQSPATGFQEVLSNRALVTITSNIEAAGLVQRFDQLTLLGSDVKPRNRRPLAYCVDINDQVWLNFVNSWITLKRAEGFFETLEAKWLM